MLRKILTLLLVFSLIVPAFASAGTYNYRGKVYVSKSYRYVGFTPQKIIIKTNIDWDKSPFGKNIVTFGKTIYADYVTIKLYSWATYPYKHWFVEDQKTYRNTYTTTATGYKPVNIEFNVHVTYYWKFSHWWWHRYVKFVITIPKDKEFYQHNSGNTKIYVKLHLAGAETNLGGSFPYGIFSDFDMTVSGWGKYWTKPTPWEKYRRYWGYSASAQEYNQIMAQQNGTGGEYVAEPNELSGVDLALISIFILAVGIFAYVYVGMKKSKR